MCFWSNFQPATMAFCEQRLCSIIAEPANTWSNIGYLLVGIYVCWLAKREGFLRLLPIGVIAVLVAIGSTFFHASGTFIGEVVDLFAMFLFANFMLCFNLNRLVGIKGGVLVALYALLTFAALALMLYVNPIGILAFTVLVTIALLLEIKIYRNLRPNGADYRYLWYLIFTFGLSYGIWRLDVHHIVCNPHNHMLQGHSLWHLLNCFCFYFLYKFYQQFFYKKP
jgi:hypothetical protein